MGVMAERASSFTAGAIIPIAVGAVAFLDVVSTIVLVVGTSITGGILADEADRSNKKPRPVSTGIGFAAGLAFCFLMANDTPEKNRAIIHEPDSVEHVLVLKQKEAELTSAKSTSIVLANTFNNQEEAPTPKPKTAPPAPKTQRSLQYL